MPSDRGGDGLRPEDDPASHTGNNVNDVTGRNPSAEEAERDFWDDVLGDPRRDDDAAEERAAIIAEAEGAFGPPMPADAHAATLAGLLAAAMLRPTSWADPEAIPSRGARCSCCGRHGSGGRWWREAEAPTGWRCWTCHPPVPGRAIVEVRT